MRLEACSASPGPDTQPALDLGAPMDDEDLGEDLGIGEEDLGTANVDDGDGDGDDKRPSANESRDPPDLRDRSCDSINPDTAAMLEKSHRDIMSVSH